MDYTIYTDGAYSRMHNEGAFAFVILDNQGNEVKHLARKIVNETNNRAELKAIIAGVCNLPNVALSVKIVSDSQYALNTLSGKWARNTNLDLFEVYDKILAERNYIVEYEWVRGHSGNEHNEYCDQLCNEVLGYDANAEFQKHKKH